MSRILQLFVHMEADEYKPLMDKYQDEAALKFFLSRAIKAATKKEIEDIKQDKALEVLGAEEKL